MPELGEIKKAYELGYRDKTGKCIWAACADCGKERWVFLRKGKPRWAKCRRCALNGNRQHIRQSIGGHSYIRIMLQPDNFFYPMATQRGCVLKHRLMMANHLKRCLLPWEIVHHRNGIKDDNRLENLELIGCRGKHNTIMNQQLKQQNNEIRELKTLVENQTRLICLLLKKMTDLFNKAKGYSTRV